MCISWKKHIAAVLLLLCLPLMMVGCGGGGGGGSTVVISGVATKGPIVGGVVSVYRLLQNGARGARIGQAATGADGSYAVSVPASEKGPIVITVTGKPGATYTSETTGLPVNFTAVDSFSAAVGSFTPGVNITVSPLTEMAFQKLPLILAAKPGPLSEEKLASSISAANAQVGALFNITDILAAPSSSPSYQAVLMVIDQMVETSKAGGSITDTTAVIIVLAQAIADVDPTAPAYQTFLSVFTTAADQVKTDNPGTVASVLNVITVLVTTPPPEPDFSDVTAPATVTGLSATTAAATATTSSVTLSWNASSDNIGVSGYDVYRDGNRVGTTTGTTFTDPSVTSNVAYAYTVVAFDAAGNRSAASQALSVTPNQPSLSVTVNGALSNDLLSQLDIEVPAAPTALSAVTTAVTGTVSSVALSWAAATDNVGVTGYDVYRDGVKIGSATSTSYTDPSVTSATAYSYTVKAFDAAGNRSAFSTALSVTPNQPSLGVTVSGQVSDPLP